MSFRARVPFTIPFSNGPRLIRVDRDVSPDFVRTVIQAVRLTRNEQGWPTTYQRSQPIVDLVVGDEALSIGFLEQKTDPVRMSAAPAIVRLGDNILTQGIFPGLLQAGFTNEQCLVLLLGHEAYHSNEAQRLQRTRLPLRTSTSPHLFSDATQPEFSEDVIRSIHQLSDIVPQTVADAYRLQRLFSKVKEGSADVHALMVFHRIYPADTLDMGHALAKERRQAWLSGIRQGRGFVLSAYDNADCILRLCERPFTSWPRDQLSVASFAWSHTLPFLLKARAVRQHRAVLDPLVDEFQPPAPLNLPSRAELRWLEQPLSPAPTGSPQRFQRPVNR